MPLSAQVQEVVQTKTRNVCTLAAEANPDCDYVWQKPSTKEVPRSAAPTWWRRGTLVLQ